VRIAISNIAWEVPDDAAVAALLDRHGVDAIDVAPGKYFPDPGKATVEEIRRVKAWWEDRGVAITGMQALLFGTSGLNLFGDPASREAMLVRLAAVCRVAGYLGATRLVFGSPKNRDRSGLAVEEALTTAVAFFRQLGEVAGRHGACICLEPNPVRYGCNFMTTTVEAATVVRAVGHPAIRLHLDTGAMTINGEDAAESVRSHCDIIAHVHASEPDLVPLGDGATDHATVAGALRRHAPDKVVSIEMLTTRQERPLEAIDRALGVATHYYRNAGADRKETS
jgi:D-psicose/D-tagatose/L-ribulose 3-epimerase